MTIPHYPLTSDTHTAIYRILNRNLDDKNSYAVIQVYVTSKAFTILTEGTLVVWFHLFLGMQIAVLMLQNLVSLYSCSILLLHGSSLRVFICLYQTKFAIFFTVIKLQTSVYTVPNS